MTFKRLTRVPAVVMHVNLFNNLMTHAFTVVRLTFSKHGTCIKTNYKTNKMFYLTEAHNFDFFVKVAVM